MGPHKSEVQLGQKSSAVVNLPMGSLGLPKSTTGYQLVPVTALDDVPNLINNPIYTSQNPSTKLVQSNTDSTS